MRWAGIYCKGCWASSCRASSTARANACRSGRERRHVRIFTLPTSNFSLRFPLPWPGPSGGLAAESDDLLPGPPQRWPVCEPGGSRFGLEYLAGNTNVCSPLASMAPSSGAIHGPPRHHGGAVHGHRSRGLFVGLRLAGWLLFASGPRGFRRDGCARCKWKTVCRGGFVWFCGQRLFDGVMFCSLAFTGRVALCVPPRRHRELQGLR